MQENYLKRDQFQAILDSRPKGMPMQTAIDMYVKNGFIIEGINDQKKPKISALESGLAGVGEGVGGIALSAIQKGGEALVERFGTEQMKQNVAQAPTLREQYRQTFGAEENPLAYSAGEFGGQVASLAAPAAAAGRLAKVGAEALGAGQKTAKLTQAGTEGLAFTAGQGLQSGEKQTLSDYAVNAGLNIAVPGVGMVAKSASENLAPRIINSLIKPLAKDFSYGKNPGKSVAELVPPSNSFEGLISNISSALNDVGSRIGSVVNQSQTLKQIDLSYTLNALDEAIKNAYKTPRTNQSLIGRLESVKSDLVDNINNGIDPQAYKQLIGDLTKWTGNASDDEVVNKALKQTYGSTRNLMDESLKKELTPEQFKQYKADSEAYGNLLSAKNAAIYRDKINERQNIISFGAKNAGLLTGLTAAVASGGAGIPAILAGLAGAGIDKALASTAFKTRMASLLTKLAPKDVKTFFETVPTAKTIFSEDEIRNFTGELKKNTKLNRGMISLNPKDWFEEVGNSAEVGLRAKTKELQLDMAKEAARTMRNNGVSVEVPNSKNAVEILKQAKELARKKKVSDIIQAETPSDKMKPFLEPKKKVTDSLEQEAKKYKSAEEFVKAQEGRFHQTSPEIASKIEKEGFRTDVMGSGNSDVLPIGVNTKMTDKPLLIQGQGAQMEVYFPKNAKIKTFETRDAVEGYFYSHPDGEKYFEAINKGKEIDKKYGKILDSLEKEHSELAKTNPGRQAMIKDLERQSAVIEEWTKEALAQSKIAQSEATKIAQKEGWDAIQINKDVGGFNRVTDNTIILNPKLLKTKSQLTDIWNKANKK